MSGRDNASVLPHGSGGDQLVDVLAGKAGTLQYLAAVLTDLRRTACNCAGRLRKPDRESRHLHVAFGRVVEFNKRAVVGDLRIVYEVGIAIHRPRPDVMPMEQLEPLVARPRYQAGAGFGENRIPVQPAVALVVHGGETGFPDQLSQLREIGEGHDNEAVLRREYTIRRTDVAVCVGLGRAGLSLLADSKYRELLHLDGDNRVQHVDLNEL